MRGRQVRGHAPAKGWRVATFPGEWEMYEWPSGPGWRSLKLIRPVAIKGGKANFWLSWNGQRFAANADWMALADQHPEILRRVEATLRSDVGT